MFDANGKQIYGFQLNSLFLNSVPFLHLHHMTFDIACIHILQTVIRKLHAEEGISFLPVNYVTSDWTSFMFGISLQIQVNSIHECITLSHRNLHLYF
jgi:hypothetical protein